MLFYYFNFCKVKQKFLVLKTFPCFFMISTSFYFPNYIFTAHNTQVHNIKYLFFCLKHFIGSKTFHTFALANDIL